MELDEDTEDLLTYEENGAEAPSQSSNSSEQVGTNASIHAPTLQQVSTIQDQVLPPHVTSNNPSSNTLSSSQVQPNLERHSQSHQSSAIDGNQLI